MGRAARRRARRSAPPLPQREGLDPVRWRVGPEATPHSTALSALAARFPALLDPAAVPLSERFANGEVLRADGTAWTAEDPLAPGDELWFHRELREERVEGPDPAILLADDHLLVVDKPHDMATMPRGAHVLASALVRLRRATGITTLTPLHRLDRRTAGVLALGIRPEERAAYQGLFARGEVDKEYLARVHLHEDTRIPRTPGQRFVMSDRLGRTRGELQTRAVPGEPNALTEAEVRSSDGATAQVRLTPRTGRTHQLRAQLALRGAPIVGDDLYPRVREVGPDDPALSLLARTLAFTDPVTGRARRFRSRRELP
jgi:tRNA pseudouridine32 synthase/23S rRNA pseudouridine746 synthase